MRAAIIMLVLVVSAGAHADSLQEAKDLYNRGLHHYNVGDYDAAIDAWKRSYLLSKRPLLLFNVGQAYRLKGDCKQALTFYDNYSREEGKPAPELEAAITECKNQPADGPPVAPRPPQEAPRPIEFGEIPKLVGEPPNRTLQIAGLATIGVGVIAGGAGAYFGYDSNKQSERLDNFTGTWSADEKAIEERGRRSVVLAYTLGGVGAAGVIAGAVMLWLGRDQRELQMEVAPIRGGGAAATIRFAF